MSDEGDVGSVIELGEALVNVKATLRGEADEIESILDEDVGLEAEDTFRDILEGLRHAADEAEDTLNEHYFDRDHDEDATDDQYKQAYIVAESPDWKHPRVIDGPYDVPGDRDAFMSDAVDARTSGEYSDVWSALRFVDDDGRKPPANDFTIDFTGEA